MLGLFVNPLTADDKYSLLNGGNLLQHFQIQLFKNVKNFQSLFLHFRSLDSIFNVLKKRMTLIGDACLNLRNPKDVVR